MLHFNGLAGLSLLAEELFYSFIRDICNSGISGVLDIPEFGSLSTLENAVQNWLSWNLKIFYGLAQSGKQSSGGLSTKYN